MSHRNPSQWSPIARNWWKRVCSLEVSADANAKRGRADPAVRAKLRRCRDRVEAFMIPEALQLAKSLSPTSDDDERFGTAIDLARVLAHIKKESPNHPMRDVGWSRFPGEKDTGERPKLAETRFKRLLQATDGEERVAAFVRLIALMGGTANAGHIAEAFRWWDHPDGWVRQRWAFEYFNAANAAPESDAYTHTEESEAS